ncbi:MAG: acylphosphatase [Candidatus Izemoplasma sp.]|nr:acylphosphatase [Candidatus Izemoplasma sp.]
MTKKYLLTGRVQGVGMRFFVRQTARRLGVKGSVKNLSNGKVECIAQADQKTLNQFEETLRSQSPGEIYDFESEDIKEETTYRKFKVRF